MHLLVETPIPNLGTGMRDLQGQYARDFNERYGRVGHVFQGRFGAVLVQTDEQMLTVTRYVARNPVKAGFCEAPAEYAWSSHRYVIGADTTPQWLDVTRLLDLVAGEGPGRQLRYQQLTEPKGA